jgi:osmoprotectant transport system permease protein
VNWLIANFGSVWQLTMSHVGLSVVPIIAGFVISVPIGWVAARFHLSRGPLLSVGSLLYAIPSIALFFAMPAILGTKILDPVNVVVALTVYALALMVRSSADALDAVSADVKLSATGIGFSAWRRFWSVELPLAGPVMLAGVRVVSVSTVSLVSVGSLLGVPSLGNLFLDGYQRNFPTEIVIGIVGSVLIAVVFDLVLVGCGWLLLPWNRQRTGTSVRGERVATVGAA